MELHLLHIQIESMRKMNIIIIWIAAIFAIYHYIISYFWIIMESKIDRYKIIELPNYIELVLKFYFVAIKSNYPTKINEMLN